MGLSPKCGTFMAVSIRGLEAARAECVRASFQIQERTTLSLNVLEATDTDPPPPLNCKPETIKLWIQSAPIGSNPVFFFQGV